MLTGLGSPARRGPGRSAQRLSRTTRGVRAADVQLLVHPYMRQPDFVEPLCAAILHQHRDGRCTAGDDAFGCRDRDAGEAADRHAGARRENMAVAPAVDLDEALVIAAGRDRALKQIERCHDSFRAAWMLDADRPGGSVGMRPDDLDVAAEIDQAVAEASFGAERRGAIRRVFLDHAAEVDFHSWKTEHESRALPADLVPAHARQQA